MAQVPLDVCCPRRQRTVEVTVQQLLAKSFSQVLVLVSTASNICFHMGGLKWRDGFLRS